MYPLNVSKPWLQNQWYIACVAREVTGKPTARTILGEPLVFFRTNDGTAVALWGLCPHRLMPLQYGEIVADTLVCGYHGFRFDAGGRCVQMPTADRIPPQCRLKSYATIERGPFVWVWMGDQANVDVTLMPDASDVGIGADPHCWRVDVTASYLLKARAQLLMDKLFDLSHVAFAHKNSMTPDVIDLALIPIYTEEVNGRFRVMRELPKTEVRSDTLLSLLIPGELGTTVKQQLVTEFYNIGLLNAGGPWMWRVNADGTQGEALGRLNVMHGFTPETANSTHYFGAVTRNFQLDNEQLSALLIDGNARVRSEDLIVLEAIEKVADRFGDPRKEISVPADAGAIQVRRRIRAMFEAEAVSEASAARAG